VESAARLYFGKSIKVGNLAEAALLAGLVKVPGKLRAHEGTEASRDRQRYVLNRMHANGSITTDEGLTALATQLRFLIRTPNHCREVEPMISEVCASR
jgi:penicillin-binding protein 1A